MIVCVRVCVCISLKKLISVLEISGDALHIVQLFTI